MRFAFYTLGCKTNQYETQAMEQLLTELGHEIGQFDQPCDGYIINTCSVTAVADKKNRAVIRRCRRDNPDAVIGVCGCYSQHAPEAVRALGVDIIGGSGGRREFVELMLSAMEGKTRVEQLDNACLLYTSGLTSATVGQTIKVKAVDTDGKPTAWEAAESGEKWEKIAEIIIPDDAEESNALTIDKDINGQPFSLLKARLCSKFPKYTGGSTIPGFSFAMLNGRANGNPSPAVYTSLWPKVETARLVGAVYEVDVSGAQVIESVLRSAGGGWGENMGMYGSSSSTYVKC